MVKWIVKFIRRITGWYNTVPHIREPIALIGGVPCYSYEQIEQELTIHERSKCR